MARDFSIESEIPTARERPSNSLLLAESRHEAGTDRAQDGGDTRTITKAAPRIGPALRAALAAADNGATAAEICRRVGAAAERLGAPRPSYEQVRVLLIEHRLRQRRVTAAELLLDVAFRARPPTDIDAWLADVPLPYRRGAKNEPQD